MKPKIEAKDTADMDLKALARAIYPALRAFYDSPDGQAEFEAWKQQIQKSTAKT